MPKTNLESPVDWSKCFLCKLQTSENLQNQMINVSMIRDCNHEEADTTHTSLPTCSTVTFQEYHDPDCWHGCCCSGNSIWKAIRSRGNMDRFWYGKRLPLHPSPCDCNKTFRECLQNIASFPCPQWLWYCVCLPWKRKKRVLGAHGKNVGRSLLNLIV